jgi:hypothetical protein
MNAITFIGGCSTTFTFYLILILDVRNLSLTIYSNRLHDVVLDRKILSIDCGGREVAENNEEIEICISDSKILERVFLRRCRHCCPVPKGEKKEEESGVVKCSNRRALKFL